MTSTYITTKIVAAWPSDKDGEPGYSVTYPDGHQSWCPRGEFERTSRPMSASEQECANHYGTSGHEGDDVPTLKPGDSVTVDGYGDGKIEFTDEGRDVHIVIDEPLSQAADS